MIKVFNTRVGNSSLFHYAHFILDCLLSEVVNKVFEYDTVFRPKNLHQTIGNFSKIYEEVTGCKNIELPQEEYDNLKDLKTIDVSNMHKVPKRKESFEFFRNYIFQKYGIKDEDAYPEIILIQRGERIQLIDDEELKKINKNIGTGRERREIDDIELLKLFLENQFSDKFKTVMLEHMSFEEQIKHFFNSKMVIGVHGAGFANNIFCKKNTIILEIKHPTIPESWDYFDVISRTLDLKHFKCENELETIKKNTLNFYNIMTDKKLITFIGLARSGTNFILNNLLKKIFEFNINLEIYARDKKVIKNCINYKYYIHDLEKKDSFEIIKYLLNHTKEKFVIHKIFPHMFMDNNKSYDQHKLTELIFFSNYIIFLKRNLLDVFVSEKKTHITNKWVHIDTSDIKINFDIGEFNEYKKRYEKWFQFTKQKCMELEKPFITIDYDELMTMENDNDRLLHIVTKMKYIIKDELTIINKEFNYITKQDNSEKYEDKIENYDEIKDFISNKDIFFNDIV